jgi:hypothetical protein
MNFSLAAAKNSPAGMSLPLSAASFHITQGRKKLTASNAAAKMFNLVVVPILLPAIPQ